MIVYMLCVDDDVNILIGFTELCTLDCKEKESHGHTSGTYRGTARKRRCTSSQW